MIANKQSSELARQAKKQYFVEIANLANLGFSVAVSIYFAAREVNKFFFIGEKPEPIRLDDTFIISYLEIFLGLIVLPLFAAVKVAAYFDWLDEDSREYYHLNFIYIAGYSGLGIYILLAYIF